MKLFYRLGADSIWILHFFVVFIALFGWLVPSIWLLYMGVLAGTLISDLSLNYCILSKLEFDLRKRADPRIKYNFAYTSYYTYRLTQGRLSPRFLGQTAVVFTSLSLLINIYFAYLY